VEEDEMKSIFITGMFLVMILAPLGAFAQPGQWGVGGPYDSMDTNHDGAVNEQEWHQAMQKRFESVDVNKDRVISPAEWEAHRQLMRNNIRSMIRKRML
jgi:hypothetical protein